MFGNNEKLFGHFQEIPRISVIPVSQFLTGALFPAFRVPRVANLLRLF